MTKLLFSSAYLPPVEYMAAFVQTTQPLIESHEHYHKQSFRNRCVVLSATGPVSLSIPVSKTIPNHCPIREMRISYAENWQRNHWKTMESCYGCSPYFLYYRDYLEPFFLRKKYDFLFDLNCDLLDVICKLLKTGNNAMTNNAYAEGAEINLCDYIHPKNCGLDEYIFNNQPSYTQVFTTSAHPFFPHMSILDLLCNKGPDALPYLKAWNLSLEHLS